MRAFFIFGIGLGVLMGSSAFGQTVKCEKGDKLIMCPTEKVEENLEMMVNHSCVVLKNVIHTEYHQKIPVTPWFASINVVLDLINN